MESTQVVSTLRDKMPHIKSEFDVKSLQIFGSASDKELGLINDVDILVNFNHPTYDKWFRLKQYLTNLLHKEIDLIVDGKNLSSRFKDKIEKDLVDV